ncbi:hypothetical protein F4818DRAFT_76678 [Hypoxylon cercidicola]|nr:hypothetical protein F4818DRAFT_76678 [Hypoxylon cercidicola]
MTDPKSNDEDDPSGPQTPQNTSIPKKRTPNTATGATQIAQATTPSKDATPKTAPAAGRSRAGTAKQGPTLLGDFLLGRPSPARVAADKKAAREAAQARRMSLEMVKKEMRQASVMRIQAPGGVHDRVKKWQKANAAAMTSADPLATPTEPSEVNIQVDEESVTEEDRVRIKSRQRKPKPKVVGEQEAGEDANGKEDQTDSRPSSPPKKRVVSDTNWMKNKKNSPPRTRSPKTNPKPIESTGSPLPKDFLARTAANPPVSKKIKDWVSKIEIPEEPHGTQHRASKSTGSIDGIRVKPIHSEGDSARGRSASTRITVKVKNRRKSKEPEGDGIRVTPMPSEKDAPSEESGSSHIVVEPSKVRVSKGLDDDGIRITPIPSEKDMASARSSTASPVKVSTRKPQGPLDDGIRVKPLAKQTRQGDNFRYKPRKTFVPKDQATESSYFEASDDGSTVRASSRRSSRIPSTHETSTRRDPSPSEKIEAVEEPESEDARTPTPVNPKVASKAASKANRKRPAKSIEKLPKTSRADTDTILTEDVSDSASWSSDSVSDMPFSIPPVSLADIPVGYSAFSELDLPSGPKGRNARPKTKRQSSFKGATSVLKKALTEGKKILTEKVDHPKPVHNRPPNIETWLKDTVDPFVDSPTTPRPDQIKEEEWIDEDEDKTQDSMLSSHMPADVACPPSVSRSEETIESKETKPDFDEHDRADATTPTSAGLKRSRATRVSSSPSKSSNRRGLKEKLKDAFRGESTGHSPPPLEYPSCPEVVDLDKEREDEHYEHRQHHERRRSSGSRKSSSLDDYESTLSSSSIQPAPPPAYHKRKPPTSGFHELSTIVSEVGSHSTLPSDYSSIVSDSTVTESTALTRSSAVSRRRSHKSGLKRRLTKHSDLVSVLSLPDDASASHKTGSLRSARSVRRSSNHLGSATIDGLLLEFEDDEDLYRRELKTLVDGVIPVLLTEFVNNNSSTRKDLFGSAPTKYKEDTLDNAVVNMGIALDDLKDHHRRRPSLSDIRRLPQWLETIHPLYNNYLDVWRLGFQGIIVNLAPKSPDDADSLINAMPRNEQGDVLDEDGERIDVAHLLRRPLLRIKWITKFIKGYRAVTGTKDFEALASKWEALQEKAKRRHKEENARVIDEDAKNSDTSRARDLKTLEALDHVRIDRLRQVFAKDTFSLDLRHSNGQRLECQVELIIRDNQLFKSDPGDLLIRETGSGGRSWLLFAPVAGGRFSARTGDSKHELVVMIRGHRDEWYELLSLTTDDENQAMEWLDMLGQSPVPPAIKRSASRSLVLPPKSAAPEIPLGERKLREERIIPPMSLRSSQSPEVASKAHERATSLPASIPSPERTPSRDSHLKSKHTISAPEENDEAYSRSYSSPEPSPLKKSPNNTPFREDGAPPPPVHRTFSAKKSPVLPPPTDQNTLRLKRRISSPLKHEYRPSEVSSEGSASPTIESDDDSVSDESSGDELEAVEIPDTTPAISIKRDSAVIVESVVSESAASITPSASASQAGAPKPESKQPEYAIKSVASISYWDDKHGRWQDLWPDLCSIVTMPGLIEAYPYRRAHSPPNSASQEERPLIALDLTPIVMLRNSTVVDLEIKSPVLKYSRLYSKVVKHETCMFRFRVQSVPECQSLYIAVHQARLDNAKYKALEEEARVRAFGQNQNPDPEGDGSSHRRSWFGRKNSYRVSARAPSQSAGSESQPSGVSASSFLKRIMRGGDQSFNIAMSSVDRQSRSAGREASLYTSSSSSATPPRSPSVSIANSGNNKMSLTTNNLKIRLHLLLTASKWEDNGNCMLEVTRPDRGTRQNLRKYQGMEKRIIVTTIPKKDIQKPVIVLDVILGSQCFSRLGSRGVLLSVWEEVKDENGQTGVVPQGGGSGGNITKWCLQCSSVQQAVWIFGLVTQEVVIG